MAREIDATNASRISKKRAKRYHAALVKLARERGGLTPRRVISAAKAKTNPLHDYFEWDNSKAAERYRIQQAGALIRAIVFIELADNNAEPVVVREFHSIPTNSGRRYEPMAIVTKNKDYMLTLLRGHLAEYQRLRDRDQQLRRVFAPIFGGIAQVEKYLNAREKREKGRAA